MLSLYHHSDYINFFLIILLSVVFNLSRAVKTGLWLHKHANLAPLFIFQDFLSMLLEDIPKQNR